MANDPMFKLEHTSDDVKKSSSVQLSVGQLEKKRSEFQDDYSLNKLARSKFRVTSQAPIISSVLLCFISCSSGKCQEILKFNCLNPKISVNCHLFL